MTLPLLIARQGARSDGAISISDQECRSATVEDLRQSSLTAECAVHSLPAAVHLRPSHSEGLRAVVHRPYHQACLCSALYRFATHIRSLLDVSSALCFISCSCVSGFWRHGSHIQSPAGRLAPEAAWYCVAEVGVLRVVRVIIW